MGYDMHVQGKDGTEAEVVDDHAYLRRNIWGMGPTVGALIALGGAYESEGPRARDGSYLEFDDVPPYNEDWDGLDAADLAVDAAYEEREVVLQALLSAPGSYDTAGIPSHKFTSNDGWHVTQSECASAVVLIERAPTPWSVDVDGYMSDDVLPFLRCAARHDGFRVY